MDVSNGRYMYVLDYTCSLIFDVINRKRREVSIEGTEFQRQGFDIQIHSDLKKMRTKSD